MNAPSTSARRGLRPIRSLLAFALVLALALALPRSARAFAYPALDTTSHWTVQNWGFTASRGFYVQGAEKKTWAGPGQPQSKTAIYALEVVGVRLNGAGYAFKSQDFLGESGGDGYIAKYGSFKVTEGVSLTVVLFFIDDGKFEVNAYFTGAAYDATQPWEVVVRMDYDMAGSGNNIAEFLWNAASEGGSMSPPALPRSEAFDGRLVYKSAKGPASGYWAAVNHEMAVARRVRAHPQCVQAAIRNGPLERRGDAGGSRVQGLRRIYRKPVSQGRRSHAVAEHGRGGKPSPVCVRRQGPDDFHDSGIAGRRRNL
jgi:hypothetical protein